MHFKSTSTHSYSAGRSFEILRFTNKTSVGDITDLRSLSHGKVQQRPQSITRYPSHEVEERRSPAPRFSDRDGRRRTVVFFIPETILTGFRTPKSPEVVFTFSLHLSAAKPKKIQNTHFHRHVLSI